jgi:hypothetical protein
MDKTLICQDVANKLFASEKAIDAAIAEAAGLLTGLTEARDELRVSMVVTDKAATKITEALMLLSQARTSMVQAHGELDEVKLRLGVRTKMIGFYNKPEAPGATESVVRRVA